MADNYSKYLQTVVQVGPTWYLVPDREANALAARLATSS